MYHRVGKIFNVKKYIGDKRQKLKGFICVTQNPINKKKLDVADAVNITNFSWHHQQRFQGKKYNKNL